MEHKPDQKGAPIWYLEGPFYRYNEDVKALARRAGVRIVDARFAHNGRPHAADDKELPKVTLRPEFAEKSEKSEKSAKAGK